MADEKKKRVALDDEEVDKVAGGNFANNIGKKLKKVTNTRQYKCPNCQNVCWAPMGGNMEGAECPACHQAKLQEVTGNN